MLSLFLLKIGPKLPFTIETMTKSNMMDHFLSAQRQNLVSGSNNSKGKGLTALIKSNIERLDQANHTIQCTGTSTRS